MGCDRLFVYGTLLPGHEPPAMTRVCSRLRTLGPASMAGDLFDLGPYPAAVVEGARGTIRGQVVEVDCDDTWAALDAYEGCPRPGGADGLFRRVPAVATLESGEPVDCWVYVYNRDLHNARVVEGGCWISRKR